MDKSKLKGVTGGAWTEETHNTLYPKNFDDGLAKYVAKTLTPSSALEFGSGLGYIAKYINDNCETEKVHCIEPNDMKGVYDKENGPILFPLNIFTDTIPEEMNRTYELIISIEVAEHIPFRNHTELFDFMVSRADKWIVFSGARVGQGGHGHIACRHEADWKSEFLKRGMTFMPDLTTEARKNCNAINTNHIKNVMVFKKP